MTDSAKAYSLFSACYPRYRLCHTVDECLSFIHMFESLYGSIIDLYGLEISRKRYARYCELREYLNRKAVRTRVNKYTRDLALNVPFYDVPRLLTLTFNDDALSTLNKETRFRYVKEWLNRNVTDYIGCIDYGKMNGREHYHFIVNVPLSFLEVQHISKRGRVNYRIRDAPWAYGFMSLYDVYEDLRRTASYAFKSSSYAFKSSSSADRVFHKRGVSHWSPLFDDDDLMGEEFPG